MISEKVTAEETFVTCWINTPRNFNYYHQVDYFDNYREHDHSHRVNNIWIVYNTTIRYFVDLYHCVGIFTIVNCHNNTPIIPSDCYLPGIFINFESVRRISTLLIILNMWAGVSKRHKIKLYQTVSDTLFSQWCSIIFEIQNTITNLTSNDSQ